VGRRGQMDSHCRTKGVGQLPGTPAYKGALDVTGITGNIVLVNSRFHARKNFYKNTAMWACALENFASPVVCPPKRLKDIGFKGRKIIAYPGCLHVSGRPCGQQFSFCSVMEGFHFILTSSLCLS
jgi:hypothetical protein